MMNPITHRDSIVFVDIDAVVDVGRCVREESALREHEEILRPMTALSRLVDFYMNKEGKSLLGTLLETWEGSSTTNESSRWIIGSSMAIADEDSTRNTSRMMPTFHDRVAHNMFPWTSPNWKEQVLFFARTQIVRFLYRFRTLLLL